MAGIAAVSFRGPLRGMAMGGRVMKHGEHFDNVATCASLHTLTYWTVSNPPPVWVVGQEGRITMFGLGLVDAHPLPWRGWSEKLCF